MKKSSAASVAVSARVHGSRDVIAHKILDTLESIQKEMEGMNARLMALESGNVNEIGMRAAYAEAKKGLLGQLARIAVTRELYQHVAGDAADLPPLPQDLPIESFFNGQR